MQRLGIVVLCLVGIYVYLSGTGAPEAAAALAGFAAVYVVLTALLMRE